jgi:hypothetical protein
MAAPIHDQEKLALDQNQNLEGSGAESVTSEESYENPTGINEKALIRKLDRKLLPSLTLLYLLSFLDRSNSMYRVDFIFEYIFTHCLFSCQCKVGWSHNRFKDHRQSIFNSR